MKSDSHAHSDRCWWDLHEARWICGAAAPAAAPIVSPSVELTGPDRPPVDVPDMAVTATSASA